MKKCHKMEQKEKVNNEKSSAINEKIVSRQKTNNKIEDDSRQPNFDNVKQ